MVTAIVSLGLVLVDSRPATMNLVLAEMIRPFRLAQDRGVAVIAEVLVPTLGIRLPATKSEWFDMCKEFEPCKIRHVNGIPTYVHGFGIELVLDGLTIDFDWGDAGEPDGFDAWRLWNFIQVNGIAVDCESHLQVRSWLEEAAENGELSQDRFLYFSPLHRARPRTTDSIGKGDGGHL